MRSAPIGACQTPANCPGSLGSFASAQRKTFWDDSASRAAARLPPEPEPEEVEPAVFKVDQLIDGKYQVQKALAAGGFGQVYKVYDGILDEVFALKIFSNASLSLSALQQEAGALAKLNHPNIVKVRGWGRLAQSGRFYLVSEFVEGEEVARFTDPDQRLSVREAVQVILDLLGALEYLHPKVDRMAELREKMSQGEISGRGV